MPYVPPKTSTYITTSLTIKQVIPTIGHTRNLECPIVEVLNLTLSTTVNAKNKSESQITATRDTANNSAVLKLDNLSISPQLTHQGNSLLRKQNGEIVKSSFKNPESKPASPKQVTFSSDLKRINIIDEDLSDTEGDV
ncbi:2472_t:CDS:1 [Racocetra fulgida]|uniref:2472_t:CDS:1 n=1 Tax=Racocetra fulgida TaxID=60492 RepID=A0A9N8W591_9GLOM|nr:2472_t:CDS:1 [Racocetra fulgida]